MRVNGLDIHQKDKILVIAPHPDDESIGVGGLLYKYAEQCEVWVMTDGRYGNEKYSSEDMIKIRKQECLEAMTIAGVSKVKYLEYEDGTLIEHKECYDKLDLSIFSMVFLPNPFDNHSDHTAVYQYAIEKFKGINVRVFLYEVHTPLSDVSCFIDISEIIEEKKKMVSSYVSQMEIHPYNEQVRALAEYRGFQNEQIGKKIETYLELKNLDNISASSAIEIELAKYKHFTRIFSLWLKQSRESSLSNRLIQKGVLSVAVYGYGIIGKQLVDELKNQQVILKYVVDKNEKISLIEHDLKVIHNIDEMSVVDLVIVTTYGHEKIVKEIKERTGLESISFADVLNM